MSEMFMNCNSLTSINLKSFETSKVTNLKKMFFGCRSLTSLDIYNFDIANVTSFEEMFLDCNESLIYCFKEENINEKLQNELQKYKNNCLEICLLQSNKYINETKECVENCKDGEYKYEYENLCYKSCPKGSHNSSKDSFLCEEGLICDNYYNNNKTDCYNEIPSGYYENDPTEKTVVKCEIECSECDLYSTQNNLCIECNNNENYYQKYNDTFNTDTYKKCYNTEQDGYYLDNNNKIYKPCYSNCKKCEEPGSDEENKCNECFDTYKLINGNCYDPNNKRNSDSISGLYEYNDNQTTNLDVTTNIDEPNSIPDTTRNTNNHSTNIDFASVLTSNIEQNNFPEITNNINEEINSDIMNYKYFYEVNEDINKIKNIYTNYTFIDIDQEILSFLREQFNLDKNEKIYININDYPSNKSNKATCDYDYRFFLGNGTELNLNNLEEDLYVDIHVPITDLDLINYNYSKYFLEQGYDIYDKNSDFYNDICTSAYIGKSDIVLKDRRKDIYPNNVILCGDGCQYNSINLEEKRFICSCNLNPNKNNTKEDEDDFLKEADDNFLTYFLDNINYKIFKCYQLISSFKNLKNNYAFYTILGIYVVILILNLFFRFYSLKNSLISMLKQTPSEKEIKNKRRKEVEERKKKSALSNNKSNPKKKKKNKNNLINININNNNNNSDKFNLTKNNKKIPENSHNINDITDDNNDNEILQKKDINELPYTQAIIYDKRNIFKIFGSLIIVKLELINLFCGNERFKIILVCEYILSLLLNFFFNTLLYSDDVISDNYHNNGELDFFVSIVLSLLSNIITSIMLFYIKFSKGIDERIDLIMELKNKKHYIRNIILYDKYLKLKFLCFFIDEIFIVSSSFYYIVIFCIVYNSSKVNILINYLMSLLEGLITSIVISLIILITRKIGLSYKNKYLYNTSKYINNKF